MPNVDEGEDIVRLHGNVQNNRRIQIPYLLLITLCLLNAPPTNP